MSTNKKRIYALAESYKKTNDGRISGLPDAIQDLAGVYEIDISGKDGRDGKNGRDGQDGKTGTVKKGGERGPGGNGTNGTKGTNGTDGKNAKSAVFFISLHGKDIYLKGDSYETTLDKNLVINASGGRGGDGGNGGRGGSGGYGSPSGRKGQTGAGGDAGNGGDGGNIIIKSQNSTLFAVVSNINVEGGVGGSGGSGDPRGSNGLDGSPGEVTFILEDKKRKIFESSDSFGLESSFVRYVADDSYVCENLTRGSSLEITGIEIVNNCGIRIGPPFELFIFSEDPLLVDTSSSIKNTSKVLLHGESFTFSGSIRLRVLDKSDIGEFFIKIAAFSFLGGLDICLNKKNSNFFTSFFVNHRLSIDSLEITSDSEEDINRIIEKHNCMKPSLQMSTFSAYLLFYCSAQKKLEKKRLDDIGKNLEGKLFDQGIFRDIFLSLHDPAQHKKIDLYKDFSIDFFSSLPSNTRGKILDTAYFCASSDKNLRLEEKNKLKSIGSQFGFEDSWFKEHLPKVLEEGDSSLNPSHSNMKSFLFFPLPFIWTYLVVSLFLCLPSHEKNPFFGIFSWTLVEFPLMIHLSIYLSVFGLLIIPYRHLFVHQACWSCGSTSLQLIDKITNKNSSLTNSDEHSRCVDCGARNNLISRHSSQSFHSDCTIRDGTVEATYSLKSSLTYFFLSFFFLLIIIYNKHSNITLLDYFYVYIFPFSLFSLISSLVLSLSLINIRSFSHKGSLFLSFSSMVFLGILFYNQGKSQLKSIIYSTKTRSTAKTTERIPEQSTVTGVVDIFCKTKGAKVFISSVPPSSTHLDLPSLHCGAENIKLKLPHGKYILITKKEGFKQEERHIEVLAEKVQSISIKLQKIGRRRKKRHKTKKQPTKKRKTIRSQNVAKITIQSNLPNVIVRWRGKKLGQLPLTHRFPVGRHTILVEQPSSFSRIRKTFTVIAKTNATISVNFQKGFIKFVVLPWAEVHVNGQKIGKTPMPPYKTWPGVYTILLKKGDKSKTKLIKLKSGGNQTIRHTF